MPDLKINATITLTPEHVEEAIKEWLGRQGMVVTKKVDFRTTTKYDDDMRGGPGYSVFHQAIVTIDLPRNETKD